MTLGWVIKQYREEHGMSMRAFAKASGLSVTYISALESGVTQRGNKPTPSLETYRSVAKAMGTDIDKLLRAIDDDVKIEPSALSEKRQAALELIEKLSDEQIDAILKLLGE